MNYNRLTDRDLNLGPVTIGERSKTYTSTGISICSGDDEFPGAEISIHLVGLPIRIAIPQVIKPWRNWTDTSRLFPEREQPCGYWDVHRKQYGFTIAEGAVHLYYGPQTHDSLTTKSKCYFIPWKQLRYVESRWYDFNGVMCELLTDQDERVFNREEGGRSGFQLREEIERRVPKRVFEFEDYDGQRILATTFIVEREYHWGEGWFKWLELFRKARIYRTLEINFEHEVGYEKGSWKGGLIGHSIELLPGELHEAAFKRYCEKGAPSRSGQSPMKFIGRVQ